MSGQIFFTSDSHYGHRFMVEHRGFSSIEEHDEHLIELWNRKVGRHDTVYHLGDLSYHKKPQTADILRRLHGHKHLILGNHDHKASGEVAEQLEWVGPYKEIRIDQQKIIMFHFPILVWNRAHYGAWHLHGHCHGSLEVQAHNRLDVGVDCHGFTPLAYEEVARLMAQQKTVFVPVDHHRPR